MSGSLPDSAPDAPPAASSVEASAPESSQEVVEESARGVDTVPAARFNGLMGKFNQTNDELKRVKAELDAMKAEREASLNANPEEDSVDISALEELVAGLRQDLAVERMKSARNDVLSKYPEAQPFADLIVADTPEGMEQVAALISERVKAAGLSPATTPIVGEEPSQEATEPPAEAGDSQESEPEAPVLGGGAAIVGSGEPDPEEKVAEALAKGSMTDFLKAAWARKAKAGGIALG